MKAADMAREPGVFRVTDFGAAGDGVTLDTRAVQAAVDAAAQHGGGEAVVPPGTFLVGTVFLRDHVALRLLPNACLLGSPRIEDYTALRWGHHMDRTPWHVLVADGVRDVAIRGEGAIAGNGRAFWEPDRPSDWHFWTARRRRPSPMVEITGCRDVRVEGVRLCDPAGWTLHLHDTDRAAVRGVRIETDPFGPNTDGLDITGCRDVVVSDCHISCGDDAIALKTTVDSRPCEYIAVSNCVLETQCVAFRVGFESRRDFRHIAFGNSVIRRCSRAIDLRSLEGAVIEHVAVSNVTGTTNCGWPVNRPVEMCLDRFAMDWGLVPEHARYGQPAPPVERGAIRHVTLSDLDLVSDGRVMLGATPGEELRDIVFERLRLCYPMIDDPLPFCRRPIGSHAFFPHLPAIRAARAAFAAENVEDLVLRGFRVEWPRYPVPDDWLLLRSPHRLINDGYYGKDEEAIRCGAKAPAFAAFWGRGLRGAELDLRHAPPSARNMKRALLVGSAVRKVRG